ncbi:MAG: response regulator transcription factor [Microbacteriaceae bacterium]|nr:response regulator transcription factor [Microbacteriaceae bacterium]
MGALIERGLAGEGYQVVWVTNGMEALMAATSTTFAAAAVDVMVPDMTGFEICRHLRKHRNPLPVLLITARDAVEDRVFGLDSGADDYLVKPFAFAEFSARIRALVRREASAVKPIVVVGAISLDTATVRATVAGAALALSAKEFSLLRMLAAQLGATVSRTEILQEVWGTTRHIDPTIVDQYVRYLRKKLATRVTGASIVTVRGSGYRLIADSPGE